MPVSVGMSPRELAATIEAAGLVAEVPLAARVAEDVAQPLEPLAVVLARLGRRVTLDPASGIVVPRGTTVRITPTSPTGPGG